MVHAGIIPNYPVTLEDTKKTDTIFGPDVLSLKGKMVRRKLKPVVSNYVKTHPDIF